LSKANGLEIRLDGADLSEANLDQASFTRANLDYSCMDRVTDYDEVRCACASFKDAIIKGPDLIKYLKENGAENLP
jgi:uncharacterized protein YjbI with pentapeptide repeats